MVLQRETGLERLNKWWSLRFKEKPSPLAPKLIFPGSSICWRVISFPLTQLHPSLILIVGSEIFIGGEGDRMDQREMFLRSEKWPQRLYIIPVIPYRDSHHGWDGSLWYTGLELILGSGIANPARSSGPDDCVNEFQGHRLCRGVLTSPSKGGSFL